MGAFCCFSFSSVCVHFNHNFSFAQIAIHEKVKEQIKDVDTLKFEVTLFWIGMAEVDS